MSSTAALVQQHRKHQAHLRHLAQQIADLDTAMAGLNPGSELDHETYEQIADQLIEAGIQLADAVLHGPY